MDGFVSIARKLLIETGLPDAAIFSESCGRLHERLEAILLLLSWNSLGHPHRWRSFAEAVCGI
jgi:hypothetical protein